MLYKCLALRRNHIYFMTIMSQENKYKLIELHKNLMNSRSRGIKEFGIILRTSLVFLK